MVTFEKQNDIFSCKILYKAGLSQKFLLISDLHFDSTYSNRSLLKKHLDEAVKENAKILIFGDLFDAMQGRKDPRHTKKSIRPEYLDYSKSYFDLIVEDLANFLEPYAEHILLISEGNHETTVKRNHEFDLLYHLQTHLYYRTNQSILLGKYHGFIRFYFEHQGGGHRLSKLLYFNHGNGGGKGFTRMPRRQSMIESDLFVSGHLHRYVHVPNMKVRVNLAGNIVQDEIEHVQLGCYKDSWNNSEWEIQKGFEPPSQGGAWLNFSFPKNELITDIIKAK